MMQVCHVVIFLVDWFVDVDLLRFIQTAEMLKPNAPISENPHDHYPHFGKPGCSWVQLWILGLGLRLVLVMDMDGFSFRTKSGETRRFHFAIVEIEVEVSEQDVREVGAALERYVSLFFPRMIPVVDLCSRFRWRIPEIFIIRHLRPVGRRLRLRQSFPAV